MSKFFRNELNYLRDVGREFARRNPKLAKYLSDRSTDPDVERLTEGFAFLTSRVREKIEDEMPEFTHSIISLIWPNFLRPFPPTALVKFTPTDRAITERQIIPRGTEMLSRTVADTVVCPFRTTTDCVVYPLEIASTQLEQSRDSARIKVFLVTLSGLPLSQIKLADLRLTFTGDMSTRQILHLWCGRYLKGMTIVLGNGNRYRLDHSSCVAPIGFGENEAILPQKSNAFEGHRLLQEFFVFPDKFYGVDLLKLGTFTRHSAETELELEFEFERPLPLDLKLRPQDISLYCVPSINLFEADADPIALDHRKVSYPVRPNDVDHTEIFSINQVESCRASDDKQRRTIARIYPAFESFAHEIGAGEHGEQVYYRARIQESVTRTGCDHEISFVLHNSKTAVPDEESLSVQLTCFNRAIAAELAVGDICIPTRETPVFATFANVTRPIAPVYPPLDGTLNWNLISNLSLNYTSLLNRDALAAILSAYDYRSLADRQAERVAKRRLEGIVSIETAPGDRLFKGMVVRGIKSRMILRESSFETEGEMYLFASVLAEFFTLYCTVNSFHQLEVRGEESGETYTWPAKIGRQPLL